MENQFEIAAEPRSAGGTGASRRLRRAGRVPAVIYGGNQANAEITLDHNDTIHHLEKEAFHSHVLTVDVDGRSEQVVLRDVQMHPYKRQVLHLDFLRVSADRKLRMTVPVHFVGEDVAPGVKQAGGVISHLMPELEIECLAKDLPEFIEVDVSALELGHSLHLSDLKLPSGVSVPALALGADHDLPVVSIHPPRRAEVEPEQTGEEAGEGEGGAD
ncbi:MAG TPA: 50S ribosomal protein L25 [Gammaproteobacteria bacterium]|uniref:50S ribosomal protein L25/general stress protein Ctc n=1 Tax=Immundisolibacter sp. TaxID=1934948 RepID=UPI000E8D4753|nr:50S ribosomal protein L25 [Gammaproteobacteria bacterium]HCZ48459.1 50S ribosomal protein L25 [Gammaproteobacteria bacterium]MCH77897.1 50S ribosomal protein L25 [Gammaproteobacteria bacterium]